MSTEVGETLLTHLSCIGELSREDSDAVRALPAEIADIPRLKDILRAGDVPDTSVVVLKGFLVRYTGRPDGSRQIHSFYIPTDSPSLETLNIDYMDNNLGAVVDSRIGVIAHADLFALMDERPNVRRLIWRETLIQAAVFREWLMRNSSMPAHAAMAHLFCEIMTRARAAGVAHGDSCDLPVTQEMLGEALGITSVHINRTLQLLRQGGLADLKNGRLHVSDFDKLAEFADFDPHYLHLRS